MRRRKLGVGRSFFILARSFFILAWLRATSSERARRGLCASVQDVSGIVEGRRSYVPEVGDLGWPGDDKEARELRSRLRFLSSRCRAPFLPIGGVNAWGSHVNALVFPLSYAVTRNRTMLSPPLGAYANGTDCATFACFFRPTASPECGRHDQHRILRAIASTKRSSCPEKKRLFTCDYTDAPFLDVESYRRFRGPPPAPTTTGCEGDVPCAVPALKASAMKKGLFSVGIRGDEAVPEPWRHRGHFWFVAHLLAWLLRPNDDLKRHLQTLTTHMGLDQARRPIAAVHVRRGDACVGVQPSIKARRCDTFDIYWAHVLDFKRKYNVRSVFLATDDPTVLYNASQAGRADGIDVFFLPPTMRKKTHSPARLWDLVLHDDRHLDRYSLARDIITDIALLARCDAFIGKFTSNVDRIAFAILVAQAGCLKPFVSLDAVWCHDHSNRVGNSIFGSFLC